MVAAVGVASGLGATGATVAEVLLVGLLGRVDIAARCFELELGVVELIAFEGTQSVRRRTGARVTMPLLTLLTSQQWRGGV